MFINKHDIILINLWLFIVAYCQKIELYEYNENEKCNISLVKEMDRIVMYGKVDFNGNIPASSVVNLEIKRKIEHNFQFLSFVKVPEDCDTEVYQYCSCYKTDDPRVFRLLLNITAYIVNSEAHVRAELVYRETTFSSEIINLPTVYGSQTDAVVVYANEHYVCQTRSNVTINETQVTIFSTCHEKFALQCELQLSNLRTESLVKSGKQAVVYTGNLKGIASFDLKYKICNVQGNISFSISTEDKDVDIHSNSGLTLLEKTLITLAFLALLKASFFLLLLIRPKMLHKMLQTLERVRNRICLRECNTEESETLLKHNTPDSHQKKGTIDITAIPIRYSDIEFKKLLEVWAKLTCSLQLKKESFSSHSRNIGCGLVTNVLKYVYGVGIETVKGSLFHVCPCPKCLKSKSPSDTWAEIFITTSSSILKNKNYHKQIMCVLSTADNVTTELRDLSVKHKDPEKTGRCVLKYVTCDQALINKLQVLLEERSRLEEQVQEKFHQHKENDQIYFAIVYRDDGTKHLRTGLWSQRKTKDDVRTYHYDPEIPFSNIGAPVVLLGYSHPENEYNHTRNLTGAYLCYTISSSHFAIVFLQK